jgi:D-glycero-D-manno-heptose 1,7-bisphosphate phosphatase
MQQTKPIILLDRDGVINYDSDQYIKTVDEWQPIPGSIEAIAALSKAGFCVYIVTNQSGIGRGYYDVATLNNMHDKMQQLLLKHGGKVEGIYYCPHTPEDKCNCRKPKAGMIESIEASLGVDFQTTPAIMVGDSKRDLEAGRTRGCQVVLMLTGKGRKTQYDLMDFPFKVYSDLAAFSLQLLFEYA